MMMLMMKMMMMMKMMKMMQDKMLKWVGERMEAKRRVERDGDGAGDWCSSEGREEE